LVAGPVCQVVGTTAGPVIVGTTLNLHRLAYRPDISLGPCFVRIR
jgi:hypothetical protein